MTNKKIIIDDIDVNALNSDEIACMNRYEVARLFVKTVERLVNKEQEYEELRQYHNKCCEENAKKLEEWLEKYNQISRDFHNGKYCNEENCNLLKYKEQELKNICKVFDIEYAIDEETGNLIGRCNKLYKKEQECEHWKKANDEKNELLAKLGCPTVATARRLELTLQQQIDKFKTERDKIKAIGDNYFDEYEMCCLDLPDAIDSLLKRYDNAFAIFKKELKELKDIKG